MSSKFIVVEGIDYSGKTTTINRLETILKENGYDVCVTREPGGGPVGEKIREILVDTPMDKDVWGLLLAATRIEHGRNVINPALNAGKVVISSRYVTSTYVYQKEAIPWLRDLTRKHKDIAEPDFLLLCDVDIDVARQRKEKRSNESPEGEDMMDDLWVPEWAQQRLEFLQMAQKLGDKAGVVNTGASESVQINHLKVILRYLGFTIAD